MNIRPIDWVEGDSCLCNICFAPSTIDLAWQKTAEGKFCAALYYLANPRIRGLYSRANCLRNFWEGKESKLQYHKTAFQEALIAQLTLLNDNKKKRE